MHRAILALLCAGSSLWLIGACQTSPSHLATHTQTLRTTTTPLNSRPAAMLSLWQQVAKHQRAGQPDQAQAWLRLAMPFSLTRRGPGGLWLRMLFRYSGPQGALKQLGIQPDAQSGTIHTAWVPLHALDSLLRLDGLSEAGIGRRLKPHLNVSAPLVFAPQARFAHGVDGRGVVVGIIDTGIDVTHPAFRNEDGTTRLIALLDFSLEGETPETPLVLTAKELNEALRKERPLPHKDTSGHGTHVAGIAAGNGRSDNPSQPIRYMGVAPRADLVVVKGLRRGQGDFNSADVVRGVQFIHQTATFLGKPYVINLSLGGHQGGHDGASLLEQALAPFTGPDRPGQVIVVSAGNEGDELIHASGWLAAGDALEVPLQVTAQNENKEQTGPSKLQVSIELWYPTSGQLTLKIRSPRGQTTDLFVPVEKTQSPTRIELEDGNVSIQSRRSTRAPHGRSYSIVLAPPTDGALREGDWHLVLGGTTPRFDAWIAETNGNTGNKLFFSRHSTQEQLIGIPASAAGVLTVGSYNSRSGWANATGEVVTSNIQLGALSPFSSMGPTRDGRAKPEIVAPGLYIAAPTPLSLPTNAKGKVPDGPYRISQGTSQAVPHLAGGVALMLQLRPRLTLEQVRHWLQRTAYTDARTAEGAVYQQSWGFGKLHLLAALNALQNGGSTQAVDPRRSTLGVLHEWLPADGSATTQIVLIPKDKNGAPLQGEPKVELRTSEGTLVTQPRASQPGIYTATLRASSTPGKAILSATIDGKPLQTQREVQFIRATNTPLTGCQCNLNPGQRIPSLPAVAWLMLLSWCILRRTR